jgi:iron complex transport system substrate-binding protein
MISFRGRFGALALAALAIAALLIAACGGDDDDSKSTPTTAASSSSTAASPTAAAYPVKVTDLLGRSVEIKAQPKSIVALSPTAVEFVYAAGGTVVGRSASVDFPEAAKSAKEVGTAYQPNVDQILALKPDLVVADSIIHAQPDLRKALEGLPVPVVFAGADSYQKVLDGLNLIGTVLNNKATTDKLVADIGKARDDAKKALAGKTVSAVALIADRDQTLYAAKPTSYAGDVLQQMGITNPAASQPDSGPFPGYTALAPEKLIQFDPDFVFTITPAPPPVPRLSTLFPQIPPFKGMKAVTTKNHVVEADVELFLQAPGPRIIDAFKAITAAVTAS